MKLDYTIKVIFADIKAELGLDISDEELADIIESQYQAALYGIAKGIEEIDIYKFGKLVRTHAGEVAANKKKVREIRKTEGDEAAEKLKLEQQLERIAWNKEKKAKRANITLDELHSFEFINKINIAYARRGDIHTD